MKIRALVLMMPLFLGACAEGTTIYHNRTAMPVPRTITVDAYQRSAVITPENVHIRLCAEAAPDTFAALSASLAAEADVVKKAGRIAAAINQSGATIERTQTINLLRESMYRTCERYLSGAISRESLIVQAARDQRTMVSVLAIEQLSRAVRPPSTVISAGATSATVPNTALIDMIADFRKQETAAKEAATAADTAFKTAGGPDTCAAARPTDDTGTIKQAAWDTCNAAKTTLADRKKDAEAATARVEKALALGGSSGGSSTAATEQGPQQTGGGGGQMSDAAMAKVADAIREIALAPGIDETLMFCVGYLDEHANPDAVVRDGCMRIVANRAALDASRAAEFFGNPVAFDNGRKRAPDYGQFRNMLLEHISRGTDATVRPSVAKFEHDAGIDTGLANLCTTRAKCLDAAADRYVNRYFEAGDALNAALAQWQ